MRLSRVTTRTLLATTASLAFALPASAQTTGEAQAQSATSTVADPAPDQDERGLGDIIVTATKRASTVQDVPFSINAQTQEDIQRANASTIEDISRNVAGLQVQNLGPGQSQVSVRGVSAGQIVRDQPGVKEQVGVYLDESVVSLSLFTPDFDLFDLNRVETLRGPQGTLFGSGSVGGTIRYITNQPRIGRTEGLLEANLNTLADGGQGGHLKGAVNVPLGATARCARSATSPSSPALSMRSVRLRARTSTTGQRMGVRLSLLWQPTDAVRLTPRVVTRRSMRTASTARSVQPLLQPFTVPRAPLRGASAVSPPPREIPRQDPPRRPDRQRRPRRDRVTSITSYIDRDILVSRDASALTGSVSVDLWLPGGAVNLPSNLVDTTDLKQWSQEVRLSSTDSGPFSWVVGGFYSSVDRQYSQRLPTPGFDAARMRARRRARQQLANGFGPNSPYNADLPYDISRRLCLAKRPTTWASEADRRRPLLRLRSKAVTSPRAAASPAETAEW
jgi:iron complex outermembrane receptor protein